MTNQDILEHLVDQHGLAQIVDALSEICRLKASHLRENWQDHQAAKTWDANARRIEACWAALKAVPGDYCNDAPAYVPFMSAGEPR
jgi:hypothetical protein